MDAGGHWVEPAVGIKFRHKTLSIQTHNSAPSHKYTCFSYSHTEELFSLLSIMCGGVPVCPTRECPSM